MPYVGTKADPKMFFFAAQEYYDQLVPQTASVNIRVPTELERAGNFSQSVDGTGRAITIIDPLTGQPFPGNIIPADRIYAPGRAVARLPADAQHDRGRQRLQLHVAGAEQVSAPRGHRAHGLADRRTTRA